MDFGKLLIEITISRANDLFGCSEPNRGRSPTFFFFFLNLNVRK
jgi:hypothetical protein